VFAVKAFSSIRAQASSLAPKKQLAHSLAQIGSLQKGRNNAAKK